VLAGGYFLVRTALKEIHHMLTVDELGTTAEGGRTRSVASAFAMILVMNIVFSFDTVLSAIALTKYFPVMVAAIIVSGLLMVWMADAVANFLKKNRMYEVLGLFVLLLVGFMLLSEGGHLAELTFFGFTVEPMSKTTFYFVLASLIVVDVTQSRFQKKLNQTRGLNG
jgi:predicted tellurium resistance membrane protein TerC